MTLRINTNISSLTANKHFNFTSTKLAKTLERLSSGLKINRSADDAAGLAIGDKMLTQTKGIDKAIQNAQMGMNFVQTAEGGVQELENIVQRIRELTIQAANDTNTRSDREKIQLEINQLMLEFDRIPLTTEFNRKLPLQIPPDILAKLDPNLSAGAPADISIIVDTSTTMAGPIANVKAQITSFINSLTAQNIDFNISVTAMADTAFAPPFGDVNDATNTLGTSNTLAGVTALVNSLNATGFYVDPLNSMLEVAGLTTQASDGATLGVGAGVSYDTGADDAMVRRSGVNYFQIVVTDTTPEIDATTATGFGFPLPANGGVIPGLLDSQLDGGGAL